jgi:hypothetical protein
MSPASSDPLPIKTAGMLWQTLIPFFKRFFLCQLLFFNRPSACKISQMSALRLQDKVAIVTGASSGLGRAISLRYAREGAKVVCADLSPTARSQVSEETEITTHDLITKDGGKAVFVQTDVGEAAQFEHLVQAAVEHFGRLDM